MRVSFSLLAVLFFASALAGRAEEPAVPAAGEAAAKAVGGQGPLVVEAPEGWTVEYKGGSLLDMYVVKRSGEDASMLMLSRWPMGGSREEIPGLLEKVAGAFVKAAKEGTEFQLKSEETVKGKIEGVEFSGEFVMFTISTGSQQAIMLVSDGAGTWNAQYHGSKERWGEALEIVKKLRKNGVAAAGKASPAGTGSVSEKDAESKGAESKGAVSTQGPLVVEPPEGWTVKHKGGGGVDLYVVSGDVAEPAVLMLSRWPAGGGREKIPETLERMAGLFLREAKKNTDFRLESDEPVKGEIEGGEFSGEFVMFTISTGARQVMFLISDGEGMWNGQFTGREERWKDVLETLKKLRKSGATE